MNSPFRSILLAVFFAAIAAPARQAEPVRFRVVLFCAADENPSPAAFERVRQYVLYTEDFFKRWLKHWGYEPQQSLKAVRDANDLPQIYSVTGRSEKVSGAYAKPNFNNEVKELVKAKYGFEKGQDVWWVFIHEPIAGGWGIGGGNMRRGGWSWAAYFAKPAGDIRLGAELADGIVRDLKLKGGIHELGHALGLPHIGPRPEDKLGNSLMGPTHFNYARRVKDPKRQRSSHLTAAAAAMLSRHPLFTGEFKDRNTQIKLQMNNLSAKLQKGVINVSGKLTCNIPAHSVVVCNYTKNTVGPYWQKMYVGKVTKNGTFNVDVGGTGRAKGGKLMIAFCLENGAVTGNNRGVAFTQTHIAKEYTVANGRVVLKK